MCAPTLINILRVVSCASYAQRVFGGFCRLGLFRTTLMCRCAYAGSFSACRATIRLALSHILCTSHGKSGVKPGYLSWMQHIWVRHKAPPRNTNVCEREMPVGLKKTARGILQLRPWYVATLLSNRVLGLAPKAPYTPMITMSQAVEAGYRFARSGFSLFQPSCPRGTPRTQIFLVQHVKPLSVHTPPQASLNPVVCRAGSVPEAGAGQARWP